MKIKFFGEGDFVLPEKFEWRLTDENAQKLNVEDVDFAFKQAEKQLEGTVNESAILISRTMILVTLIIGLTTSLIAYVIEKIESHLRNYSLIITSVIAIAYLLYQLFSLIKNLRGHKYATSGSEPALLLDEYYVITLPDKEKRQIAFYLNELKSYQKRIYSNKVKNAERWKVFNNSLEKIAVLPFLLMSCYVVIKILFKLL